MQVKNLFFFYRGGGGGFPQKAKKNQYSDWEAGITPRAFVYLPHARQTT
jgi:hypothetical protein